VAAVAARRRPAAGGGTLAAVDMVEGAVVATFPVVAGAIAAAVATADDESWCQAPGVRCPEPGASEPTREFEPVILSEAKDPRS